MFVGFVALFRNGALSGWIFRDDGFVSKSAMYNPIRKMLHISPGCFFGHT